MADPWTFKDGVYTLNSTNPKDKARLLDHISDRSRGLGRDVDFFKDAIINGERFRLGSVDKFKSRKVETLSFRSRESAKKKNKARTKRTTQPDTEVQKWINSNNRIARLRNELNSGNITEAEFEKSIGRIVKRNRLDIGLGAGKFNYEKFNQSPLRNGWPEGASAEGYTKFLKNNYKIVENITKELEKRTGIKFDVGHPQAGAPNISLAQQLRYHVRKGNQNVIGILPEFKSIVKKATDDVRTPGDLNMAGIPFQHRGAFTTYLNQFLPKSNTIDFDAFPENLKSSILFDEDYAKTADSAVTKALHELEDQAGISYLRRKNPIRSKFKPHLMRDGILGTGFVSSLVRGTRGLAEVVDVTIPDKSTIETFKTKGVKEGFKAYSHELFAEGRAAITSIGLLKGASYLPFVKGAVGAVGQGASKMAWPLLVTSIANQVDDSFFDSKGKKTIHKGLTDVVKEEEEGKSRNYLGTYSPY